VEKRTFKTTRQLTINKVYRDWKSWSVGDIAIGEIIGFHTDKYGKTCYVMKAFDIQFKKDSEKYREKNLVLNSNAMLTKAMKVLPENGLGSLIQVEYQGTSVLPEKHQHAGKDAHIVDVQISEETTSDVSPEL
jgi:hypothetical protein